MDGISICYSQCIDDTNNAIDISKGIGAGAIHGVGAPTVGKDPSIVSVREFVGSMVAETPRGSLWNPAEIGSIPS